jgi:adenylate cyclase
MTTRRYGGELSPLLPSTPSGGYVLVVDDQEENRLLMKHFLTSEGYRVELADNGTAAFERIRTAKPDLILLDVMMPGDNGFEICRKLKLDPETLAIPVVLVTGLQRKDDRIAGKEVGADDFLSKPVYPEELLARARSLMRLSEARRALEEARLASEVEQRQRIHQMFERYVSPNLVKEILTRSEASENPLDRQSRIEAVALFADLRGFTRMAEKLDADVVVDLLNEFFTLITSVAYSFEGTVISMSGDSLLVGFGVPLPQADSSARAIESARTMVRRFRNTTADWRARHDLEVGVGIGIGRGMVIAGNVGSPTYMSYTIIGDAVNVAARLMQSAQANEILISESALEGAGDTRASLATQPLPPITLKGKSRPLNVFRIVA